MTSSIQLRRAVLRNDSRVHFVEPAEFCAMAISSRNLVRHDDREAELKGLSDSVTGELYVTEKERLLEFAAH